MNKIEDNKLNPFFQSVAPQNTISPIKAAVISAAVTTIVLGTISVIVEIFTGTSLVTGAAFLLSTAAAFLIAHPMIISIGISVLILAIPLVIAALYLRSRPSNLAFINVLGQTMNEYNRSAEEHFQLNFKKHLERNSINIIIPVLNKYSTILPDDLANHIREKIEGELEIDGELSSYTEAWLIAAIKFNPLENTRILPERTDHPLLNILAEDRNISLSTDEIWNQISAEIQECDEISDYARRVNIFMKRTEVSIPPLPN